MSEGKQPLKAGRLVLRFPAVSQYALYPTKHYPVHPELGERDLLKETIVACRKRGIKVISYVAVNVSVWPEDLQGEAAQWLSRDASGRPVAGSMFSLDGQEKYLRMCLLSPFAERIKALVEEIARDKNISPEHLARWFGTDSDGGRPTYAQHLSRHLSADELLQVQALFEAQLRDQAVAWTSQVVYVAGHK